jgi:transcriptional regulator with XRE-family HTH domain
MTQGVDFDARLGAALREARLNAGYTQEEIARVLRVTPATIARYELGVRHLSASMLLQIATALDIPLSRLVPGADRLERTALLSLPASPQQQAVQALVRVLEEHPDLMPKVLETVEAALDDEQRHIDTQITTDGHGLNER